MTDYRFKVGMDLQMTGLPYVEALALAQELDAKYGWFGFPRTGRSTAK